jgi:hypothetical protein
MNDISPFEREVGMGMEGLMVNKSTGELVGKEQLQAMDPEHVLLHTQKTLRASMVSSVMEDRMKKQKVCLCVFISVSV